MNYLARQKKLAAALRLGGFDGAAGHALTQRFYLCGFTGSAGVLLLHVSERAHKLTFYTDGRYTQQADDEVQSARIVVGKRAALIEGAKAHRKPV